MSPFGACVVLIWSAWAAGAAALVVDRRRHGMKWGRPALALLYGVFVLTRRLLP